MKKDKEWLKQKLNTEKYHRGTNELKTKTTYGELYDRGVSDGINVALEFIEQLDEPEVTLDKAFEKVAESYLMTKEEIWRHLERLETHGGKVTYDEPEVLSQQWIDENIVYADVKGNTEAFLNERSVRNLIVPKQEKPVVPQFVADYIEQSKKDNDSINQVFAFMDDKEDKDLWHWLFPSMYEEKRANQEVFMRAWLDGYEVEKEKKYRVVFRSHKDDLILFKTGEHIFIGAESANNGCWKQHFTEAEIKAIDKRFWAFAEEVTE